MADFECSSCGHFQLVDDKHIGRKAACPKCKTKGLVVAPANAPTPSAFVMPAAPSGETVFYDSASALVTNTRAVINGITYSLSNITSVRCTHTELPNNNKRLCGSLVFGLAKLLYMSSSRDWQADALSQMAPPQVGGEPRGVHGVDLAYICSFALIVLGIGLMQFVKWKKPTLYRLVIGSAGGEKHALQSEHVEQIEPIVEALNKAIVSRG
jgi:hypothetical protein